MRRLHLELSLLLHLVVVGVAVVAAQPGAPRPATPRGIQLEPLRASLERPIAPLTAARATPRVASPPPISDTAPAVDAAPPPVSRERIVLPALDPKRSPVAEIAGDRPSDAAFRARVVPRRPRPTAVAPPSAAAPAPRPPAAPTPTAAARRPARLVPRVAPPPRYPGAARRRGLTGRVVVEVVLDDAGGVRSARVVQSSGHGLLDRAALAAVRRWRYPAGSGGRRGRVPFRFRLR